MAEQRRDPGERIAIPCACRGCTRPAAVITIVNGRMAVEVRARHDGQTHTTTLTLGELAAMLQAEVPQVSE